VCDISVKQYHWGKVISIDRLCVTPRQEQKKRRLELYAQAHYESWGHWMITAWGIREWYAHIHECEIEGLDAITELRAIGLRLEARAKEIRDS